MKVGIVLTGLEVTLHHHVVDAFHAVFTFWYDGAV